MQRLRAVLDGDGHSAVATLREVRCDDEARALRFVGSPTLRVDGRDVEPAADAAAIYGLGCRIYRSARGASGAPPQALIRDGLARALNSPRGTGSGR